MQLIKVLELNHQQDLLAARDDLRKALLASADDYTVKDQAHFRPQLLFAVQWVLDNIPTEETILLLGLASLGARLGVNHGGILVLTDQRLGFVRHDRQVFLLRSDIQQAHVEGFHNHRKLVVVMTAKKHQQQSQPQPQQHTWARIHEQNAAAILEVLNTGDSEFLHPVETTPTTNNNNTNTNEEAPTDQHGDENATNKHRRLPLRKSLSRSFSSSRSRIRRQSSSLSASSQTSKQSGGGDDKEPRRRPSRMFSFGSQTSK